jgi:hypothetical protein
MTTKKPAKQKPSKPQPTFTVKDCHLQGVRLEHSIHGADIAKSLAEAAKVNAMALQANAQAIIAAADAVTFKGVSINTTGIMIGGTHDEK